MPVYIITALVGTASALLGIVTAQQWQDRREKRKELSNNIRAKEEAYAAWLGTCWTFINHCVELGSTKLAHMSGKDCSIKALADQLHLLASELDSARILALLREEDDAFRHRGDQIHGRVSHLGVNQDVQSDAPIEVIAELRKFQQDLADRLSRERRQAAKGKARTPAATCVGAQ